MQQLQASRYELKYLIPEECAVGVRRFIQSHLDPDEFALQRDGHSYPVFTLYLDTASLDLYRATACGLKNRFKLRIRFYDGKPTSPAFLEIKGRVNDVIRKERAPVSRAAVRRLLEGGGLSGADVYGGNGSFKAGSALQRFCDLYNTIGAGPCIYVSYVREAYVSPHSDQIRVTFDRHIVGSWYDRRTLLTPPTEGVMLTVAPVVLEVKFTDRYPLWLNALSQSFNLQRTSVAKYAMCVEAMHLGARPGAPKGFAILQ